jgi:hypothetical protein
MENQYQILSDNKSSAHELNSEELLDKRFARKEDVDSDVLNSTDDDRNEEEDEADDGNSYQSEDSASVHDSEMDLQTDEFYHDFIRAVFEDDNERSFHSGTDEDDDEYQPDTGGKSDVDTIEGKKSDDDYDYDDDESNFATISKHEVYPLKRNMF